MSFHQVLIMANEEDPLQFFQNLALNGDAAAPASPEVLCIVGAKTTRPRPLVFTELVDRELHTTVGRPHSLSNYHEQMAQSLARGCVDATWLDCGHWMPIAARHRTAQEASVIRTELHTRPGFADCSLAALPYIDTPIFIKCPLAVSLYVAPVTLQVATALLITRVTRSGPCALRTVPATVPASSALCSHLTQVKGGPSVPCRNNTTFPSITTTILDIANRFQPS